MMGSSVRERKWGLWWVLVVVGVASIVVGCGRGGGPVTSATRALVVQSEVGVAALDVRGVVDSEALVLVGVRVPEGNVLAWPHVSGDGEFVVAVISSADVMGEVVALVFEERVRGVAPEDVKVVAYDAMGVELQAESVSVAWVTVEVAGLHVPEVVVAGWDAALVEEGVQVHGYR
jgi:hypothetical protein